MTTVPHSGPATGLLATLGHTERRIVHGALLGQVDDNHAGGMMGWDEDDFAVASELLLRFTTPSSDPSISETERRAVALALIYPVYDEDHPILHPDEARVCEEMLTFLAHEFGR